jgi:hypothetical protein
MKVASPILLLTSLKKTKKKMDNQQPAFQSPLPYSITNPLRIAFQSLPSLLKDCSYRKRKATLQNTSTCFTTIAVLFSLGSYQAFRTLQQAISPRKHQ